ncbi:c-type cytochrome [Anaeromyxobacter diazotrophicus]|uniref:c-type cytochrome n=1 Tax=Anaeromyxobacter diazotrophicus TaxID=2590199 RepID=UPI00159228B0|nr:cytochrome c [Anaeromyxobacter diazotrophicus]
MRTLIAWLAVAVSTVASADGAATYNAKCKMCHGPEGAGSKMVKKPIAGLPAAQVKSAITEGSGTMKPVRIDDADAVAAYVAGLRGEAPAAGDASEQAKDAGAAAEKTAPKAEQVGATSKEAGDQAAAKATTPVKKHRKPAKENAAKTKAKAKAAGAKADEAAKPKSIGGQANDAR